MNALHLLTTVEALGVALRAEDRRLLYRPRGTVPANLRAQLSAHKDEIIEWLNWPVEAADCRPGERHPPVGQVVSTPLGRGQLVAVLPEFVAVKLFDDPLRPVNFLPCEIEPLRGASREGCASANS